VEGGGGGLIVSGVSRNRGSFVKCVVIRKRLGIPALGYDAMMAAMLAMMSEQTECCK
jgi:hypothetical protein